TRPATNLLADFEQSDASLFVKELTKVNLKPVKWEQILGDVYVPSWQKEVNCQEEALRGMTVADVPGQFSNGALVKRIKNPPGIVADLPQRVDIARSAVGCALCLALLRDNWTFHTLPGEMYCEKDGQRLEPFALVQKVDRRQLTAEQWKDICERARILNLPLVIHAAAATNAAGQP